MRRLFHNYQVLVCIKTMVPPLWRLGEPWGDLGNWGALRSRLRFLLILRWFWDPILQVCWAPWTNQGLFCHGCFQASFSAGLGYEWASGVGKPNTWYERYCKNHFSWKFYFSWFQVHFFLWFWVALGPICMTFVALETGLKFDDSSWWCWGYPRSWEPSGCTLNWRIPGP